MIFIPKIRMIQDNQLTVTIKDITAALAANYTAIYIYEDTDAGGAFATQNLSITLVANTTEYTVYDGDGTTGTYYKAALYGASASPTTTAKSALLQNGTYADNVYCTSYDVRAEMASGGGTLAASSTKYGDIIWDLCVQASRMIDNYKTVEPGAYRASDSVTRYYYGSGDTKQLIDRYVSISAVGVDETGAGSYTAWSSSDYDTWPYNASQLNEPIRRLDVADITGTTKSIWTRGARRVEVTGVAGVSTTPPEPVQRAARILATRWYKRSQQAWQDASANADLGTMLFVKQIDPDVKTILAFTYPHTGAGI